MKAKPAASSRASTMALMRMALWLFAALSLAELAPAFSELSRIARAGLAQADCIAGKDGDRCPHSNSQVVATEAETPAGVALAGSDPCVDGEDGYPARVLRLAGKPATTGTIAGSQLLHGQRLAAFHSRAPPRPA